MSALTLIYPRVSDILPLDKIPNELEGIRDALIDIFDDLYVKDLFVNLSADGSSGYYSLKIVSFDPLGINLPFAGGGEDSMKLVINPTATNTTEIPVVIDYSWIILKYLKQFSLDSFDNALDSIVQIFFELAETTPQKFLKSVIVAFIPETDAILSLITKLNTDYTTGILYDPNEPEDSQLAKIIDTIDSQGYDLVKVIVKSYLEGDGFSEGLKRVKQLFNNLIDNVEDNLKEAIKLHFTIQITNLSLGLRFPRKWLQPVYDGTTPIFDENSNPVTLQINDPLPDNYSSYLTFNVGSLVYSTDSGLKFYKESSFDLNKSMIGKTGLLIEFDDLKIDLSDENNIPEAEIDGRSEDFKGVYAKKVAITLPAKWFKEDSATPSTVQLAGHDILVGTGGLSGTIALEAVGGDNILWKKIGSSGGFRVGFELFDITFKQNKVTSSNIKGALEIKKFVYPADAKYPNGNPIPYPTIVNIGIEGHLHDNGDFNLTASAKPPYPIELPDVFTYNLKTVELGKEDDDFYIGTSGSIEFQGFLKDTLNLGPIEIERLRIYSDGSIELIGGSINLIKPIVLSLGPVEITVSAIHYGSHQKEVNGQMRKFNYFGFDGGISVDPLGIEIRGDGVKFYYCSDNLPNKPDSYLHIQTLYLDLTIPSKTPVAIINGWLSIPEPGVSKEYAGGIKLQLPKAKISGSADMKLMPKYPAFIIDAEIEFPAPIPLGTFAIYGFRGLMGYRYVAEKEAIGLVSGVNTWYDYYKAPPRGIHVQKFNGPDKTTKSGTPISIGAGASLGTSFDNGTVLNIKAMVLLSIPSLFMIDGRAAIISARLGLEDTKDPPFFAFVALGDNSLEFGFGADFKMPTKTGAILSLYAEVQAGFFFNSSSKWYVNVGTKTNPITARILTLITLKSYVMLSAKGIEAGARGDFDFQRKYGIIKVHAWAYIEVGGKVSFGRPQFGAYLKAGVGADIDIKFLSFYLAVDILFGVEAPKPFLIYGKFYYKVKIRILWVFKFSFSGDLEVYWEFDKNVDRTPMNPFINADNTTPFKSLVKGVNMLSNEVFELAYIDSGLTDSGAPLGLPQSIIDRIIPLDTYIDIKTEKGLLPGSAISAKIGGYNNPASNYTDLVPPDKVVKGKELRQVKHQYSIEKIDVKSWNGTGWVAYNPYDALYPNNTNGLNTLKIGQFQKTDGQYNTVRLLATTPFSYTEQGQPGWYIPEQYGVNATTLFCEGQQIGMRYADFVNKPLGQQYYSYTPNDMFYSNEVAFLLTNRSDSDNAIVTNESNVFNISQSLAFKYRNKLQLMLPQPSVKIELDLSSFSYGVRILFYAPLINDNVNYITYGNPDPNAVHQNLPHTVVLEPSQLDEPYFYVNGNWRGVTKIVIESMYPSNNLQQVNYLNEQIAIINETNDEITLGLIEGEIQSTTALEDKLTELLCRGVEVEGQSFVNKYVKRDALNYYYSEEFIESDGSFLFCVGQTVKQGLISKIGTNGNVIWERTYRIKEEADPLIFRKIIQLNFNIATAREQSSGYGYIVHASTHAGSRNYLLSIDPNTGDVIWVKYINWKDKDVQLHIEPATAGYYFYIVISDRNEIDTNDDPFIGKINSAGDFISGKTLVVPKEEFIINSLYSGQNGVAVAGRDIAPDSRSIIFRFDDNLEVLQSLRITDPYTTIHSIKILDNKNYLVSGYHNKNDSLFVSEIAAIGSAVVYSLPDTKNRGSLIELNEDGFYLLSYSDREGVLYRINPDMGVVWIKEITLKGKLNGVRDFTFNEVTQKITINGFHQSEGSFVAYTDANLESCMTNTRETVRFAQSKCTVERLQYQDSAAKLTFGNRKVVINSVDSEKVAFCPTVYQPEPCKKDDKICALNDQIEAIYSSCFQNPATVDPKNLTQVRCASQIKELLAQFDKDNPSYGIFKNLQTAMEGLNIFIDKPNLETYTQAWNAVQSIIRYLVEAGNCDCGCDDSKDHILFHKVGWLSTEDYQYNINIPGQEAISADAQAAIDGINKYIQPIWRPDTNYIVHFELKDTVDDGSSSPGTYKYTYGFTTAGPIGYFHTDDKATYGDIALKAGDQLTTTEGTVYVASNGQVLEDTNGIIRNADGSINAAKVTPHPDKYALTSLKQYIDYNRSYPNADGNLLSAKPLFYNDETTQIYLFFNKAYVTHFFNKWESYNNKPITDGRLKIVIKDPVEDVSIVNPPYLDYDETDVQHINIPQSVEQWNLDNNPQIPFVISQYANLFGDGRCTGIIETIKPASEYVQITPKHLKPNKLYTVIVNNMYDVNHNGSLENTLAETREVHKFVFKTSRYATFEEQVESYYLEGDIEGEAVQKEAIFKIEKAFTTNELNAAYNVIVGQPITGFPTDVLANLNNNYQHPFDRVFEGILGFTPLDAPISNEINVIRNSTDGKIVGVLVRNPEPYNNPKFPLSVIEDTIVVMNGNVPNSTYKVLFSKDNSQAIIMNSNKSIIENLDLRFRYKIYKDDTDDNPDNNYIVSGEVMINDIAVLNN